MPRQLELLPEESASTASLSKSIASNLGWSSCENMRDWNSAQLSADEIRTANFSAMSDLPPW